MGHLPVFRSYTKEDYEINDMDKTGFLKILHKYQQGKSTKEEKDFLEGYYNLFEEEEDVLKSMSEKEKQEYKMEIRESVLGKIYNIQSYGSKVRYTGRKSLRLAAAIVLFMIAGAFAFYLVNRDQDYNSAEKVVEVNKDNRVIFLPDGSKVILSAGSKLNYPSSFDGLENREVTLIGEGYFDIRHNASRPFIVHSGKIETVVLGTAFNVRAIAGQENITVTVTRGKVKVVDLEKNKVLGIITPNQQIVYNVKKVNSVMNSVDTENYLTWMNADLLCDNLTLAEVVELVQDRYKVKIAIEDPSILSQRFTTTFSNKEKLDNILETICLFNNLEYAFDSTRSTFIIKNKK